MLRDIERVLLTGEQISERIKSIAEELKKEYEHKNPLI